ncbi:hypothetical protein YC2023_039288 [Brassica napus]
MRQIPQSPLDSFTVFGRFTPNSSHVRVETAKLRKDIDRAVGEETCKRNLFTTLMVMRPINYYCYNNCRLIFCVRIQC